MHEECILSKIFVHLLKYDIPLKIKLIAYNGRTEAAIDHTLIKTDIQSITRCTGNLLPSLSHPLAIDS